MTESNAAVVAATSATAEVDPTYPSIANRANQPIPDMVGQGGEVTCSGMPQPNTAKAPQHCPLQPLHFSVGRLPLAVQEREKLDLLKERLRANEGFGSYSFADMAE